MNTKPVKVSELSGPALDWAVAKCEGWDSYDVHSNGAFELENLTTGNCMWLRCFQPSTDWSLAGPIIERERISIDNREGYPCRAFKGTPVHYEFDFFAPEGSPLIAAMRCYCASRLGELVDIPTELL